MLETLTTFVVSAAAEAGHEETSKAPFYIAGLLLAGWAVLLTAFGMSRQDWPKSDGPARGVMGITAILMVGVMAAAIATG